MSRRECPLGSRPSQRPQTPQAMKLTKSLLSKPAQDARPRIRIYEDLAGSFHVQRLTGMSVGGIYETVACRDTRSEADALAEQLTRKP